MNSKNKKSSMPFRKKKTVSPLLWIGGALLAVILLVVSFRIDFNPVGEKVEVMPDRSHVPEDTDPGPYYTNPPTSGTHYAEHFTSEFFEENIYDYPEGFLVHNLEHGYAIFWYNCELLDATGCVQLKNEIRDVMDKAKMYKVIGYPWPKIDVPVVITSWGRMLELEQFDRQLAYTYVSKYREKSPEPWGD